MTSKGEGRHFKWEVLIPRLLHPVKVAVIEALDWIDEPLSARQLDRVLDEQFSLPLVSYHMRKLAEVGAIEVVEQRAVRGAVQTFYVLADLEPVDSRLCHK